MKPKTSNLTIKKAKYKLVKEEESICLSIVTSFIAFHYWKKAPKEVAFLRHPHRHIFLVRLTIPVTEKDRELEFFILQKELGKYCKKHYLRKTFSKSCEMIASEIRAYFNKKYKTNCSVSVMEDGENGAIVS